MGKITKLMVTATSSSGSAVTYAGKGCIIGASTGIIEGTWLGRLVGIRAVSSADTVPSDNWDLTLAHADCTFGATTAVAKTLFTDITVSQTGVVEWLCTEDCSDVTDGAAATTAELPPLIDGALTLTVANIGASKEVYITIYIEVW